MKKKTKTMKKATPVGQTAGDEASKSGGRTDSEVVAKPKSAGSKQLGTKEGEIYNSKEEEVTKTSDIEQVEDEVGGGMLEFEHTSNEEVGSEEGDEEGDDSEEGDEEGDGSEEGDEEGDGSEEGDEKGEGSEDEEGEGSEDEEGDESDEEGEDEQGEASKMDAEEEKKKDKGKQPLTQEDSDSMDAFQTASVMPAKKVLMLGGGAKKTKTQALQTQNRNTRSSTSASKKIVTEKKKKRNTMASRQQRMEKRLPPSLFVDTMKSLTEMQRGWVKSMGFGQLLELEIRAIPHCLAYWLVQNFVPARCELELANGKHLHITEEDVHHVLGLPKGEIEIQRRKKKDNKEKLELWKKEFSEKEVRPVLLVDKMEECHMQEDEEMFKRHFIAFFIALMVESTKKGSCMVELFIEDVENIQRMNWCKLVIDCLVHSRLEWKGAGNFQGPILFLVLFYVDRVMILGRKNPQAVPVFKGWSEEALKRREKEEEKVGGFGNGHVIENPSYLMKSGNEGDRLEDAEAVLKEKSAAYEAVVKDLVETILKMDSNVRRQPQFQDKIKAMKVLVGESQYLLHQGEKVDKELWGRAEKVEEYRKQLVEEMRRDEEIQMECDTIRSTERGVRIECNVEKGNALPEKNMDVEPDARNEATAVGAELGEASSGVQSVVEKAKKTPEKVTKKRKGATKAGKEAREEVDEEASKEEENLANKRPKRSKKVGADMKSPYLARITKIAGSVNEEEKLTWAYMFTDSSVKSSIEQVFKNESKKATKAMLRSLDQVVDPNVIDIWSFLVNKKEAAKSGEKPARVCMKVYRYNAGASEVDTKTMNRELEEAVVIDTKRYIKQTEMILIPVMMGENKYILIAFNLKFPAIDILDGISTSSTPTKEQELATNKLTEYVCSFLAKHSLHHKKKAISEAELSVIQLPWANPSNPAASGILCMRHMEGYMGAQFKQWETELKAENSDAYQKRLRVIYLNKIVMSESNEVKEKIKKKMEEYKKSVGVLKALVVTGK